MSLWQELVVDVPNTKALSAVLYSPQASPTAALSCVYMGSVSILGTAVIILPVLADPGVCSILDVRVGEVPSICGTESVRCNSAGFIVESGGTLGQGERTRADGEKPRRGKRTVDFCKSMPGVTTIGRVKHDQWGGEGLSIANARRKTAVLSQQSSSIQESAHTEQRHAFHVRVITKSQTLWPVMCARLTSACADIGDIGLIV